MVKDLPVGPRATRLTVLGHLIEPAVAAVQHKLDFLDLFLLWVLLMLVEAEMEYLQQSAETLHFTVGVVVDTVASIQVEV